jgi:hypothetical protein
MDCPRCGHHFSKADQAYAAHIILSPWRWRWQSIKRYLPMLVFGSVCILLALLLVYLSILASDSKQQPSRDDVPLLQQAEHRL